MASKKMAAHAIVRAMFEVSKRVAVLREEIFELKTANHVNRHKNDAGAVAERQRRGLRLREIQSELQDLSRRLKPER